VGGRKQSRGNNARAETSAKLASRLLRTHVIASREFNAHFQLPHSLDTHFQVAHITRFHVQKYSLYEAAE